jgi:hypothetical protein
MGITLSRKCERKPILSVVEKEKVVQYILGKVWIRYGHPMSLTELKIKVTEAT